MRATCPWTIVFDVGRGPSSAVLTAPITGGAGPTLCQGVWIFLCPITDVLTRLSVTLRVS